MRDFRARVQRLAGVVVQRRQGGAELEAVLELPPEEVRERQVGEVEGHAPAGASSKSARRAITPERCNTLVNSYALST